MQVDLGVTAYFLGTIDTAFLVTYALGQMLFVSYAEQWGVRRSLCISYILSGICCIVFGSSSHGATFIVMWLCNGLLHSLAFPLTVRILMPWFSAERRGSILGFWTTSQQAGSVISTAFAAWAAGTIGWRSAFIFPGILVMVVGCIIYWGLIDEDPNTYLSRLELSGNEGCCSRRRKWEKVDLKGSALNDLKVEIKHVLPNDSSNVVVTNKGGEIKSLRSKNKTIYGKINNELETNDVNIAMNEYNNNNMEMEDDERSPMVQLSAQEDSSQTLHSNQMEKISLTPVHLLSDSAKLHVGGISYNASNIHEVHSSFVIKKSISLNNEPLKNNLKKHLNISDDNNASPDFTSAPLFSFETIEKDNFTDQNIENGLHQADGVVSLRDNDEIHNEKFNENEELISGAHISLRTMISEMPYVINVGFGYFFMKLVRYSLLFWLPYFLGRQLGYPASIAGYASLLFDVGGIAGAIVTGIFTDKCLRGQRVLAASVMSIVSGFAAIAFAWAAYQSTSYLLIVMFILGFSVAAPDSVLGAAVAQDLCDRSKLGNKALSTATGFINGLGSIGAVLQGYVMAGISEAFGWDAVFWTLGMCGMVAGLILLPAAIAMRPGVNTILVSDGESGGLRKFFPCCQIRRAIGADKDVLPTYHRGEVIGSICDKIKEKNESKGMGVSSVSSVNSVQSNDMIAFGGSRLNSQNIQQQNPTHVQQRIIAHINSSHNTNLINSSSNKKNIAIIINNNNNNNSNTLPIIRFPQKKNDDQVQSQDQKKKSPPSPGLLSSSPNSLLATHTTKAQNLIASEKASHSLSGQYNTPTTVITT